MKKRIILTITALLLLVAQMPVIAQNARISGTEENAQINDKCDTEASFQEVKGEEVPLSVLTDEDGRIIYTDSTKLSNATLGQPFTETENAIRQAIIQGVKACEESVNLYEYRITVSDLKNIVQDIRFSEPDVFHLENSYRYSRLGDYVYDYIPTYTMDQDDYAKACELVENEVEKILKNSNAQRIEDDYLQALLLNDYITVHYEYDTTYTNYDMYSMIRDKRGVCQAYTLLYDELLTRCGIEVTYAQSDAMNHIWNLVKIGQHYYHVDVTWNDPTSDRYGRACHDYFMLSDETFYDNPNGSSHYDWISYNGIKCEDTTYDSSIVTSSRSSFATDGKDVYYIQNDSGKICRYQNAFTQGETLYTISDCWYTSNDRGYYPGTYSGLVCFEGKLYFNTTKTVGVYDLMTDEVSVAVTIEENDDIIGLRYNGGRTVEYAIAPDPYSNVSRLENYIIPETATYQVGDVNKDGKLNIDDVNSLLIYLAGMAEGGDWNADVTKDGSVNVDDLNALLIELSIKE